MGKYINWSFFLLELIDEGRKYKNFHDDFGKRRYRELQNRINRKAIVAKNGLKNDAMM